MSKITVMSPGEAFEMAVDQSIAFGRYPDVLGAYDAGHLDEREMRRCIGYRLALDTASGLEGDAGGMAALFFSDIYGMDADEVIDDMLFMEENMGAYASADK